MHPGRNGIGAGLVDDPNIGEYFSHQVGNYDSGLTEELGGAGFERSSLDSFNNDKFGTFQLSRLSNSDWINDYSS